MTTDMLVQTQTPADKTQQAITILQRSFCLYLQLGWLGKWRKVDAKSLQMEKDGEKLESEKKALTVTKRLVDSSYTRKVESIISGAKSDMRRFSINSARVFGPGTFIVPNEKVQEVEDMLNTRLAQMNAAKVELAAQWAEVIEDSKTRLGKLFNAAEFPTADDVLADYDIEWSYVSFSAPDRLETVDSAIFEASKQKYQKRLSAAYEEVLTQVRTMALTTMQELASRLKPGDDGKPKVLRETALRDLQSLVEQLPFLNLTDDSAVAAIVAKVGGMASGLSVDVLRDNKMIRSMLQNAAEEAVARLDELITTGAVRSMDLS